MTEGEVTLTAEEAEHVCETLIAMAVRLPLKYRDHEQSLNLLRWLDRRGTTSAGNRPSPSVACSDSGSRSGSQQGNK